MTGELTALWAGVGAARLCVKPRRWRACKSTNGSGHSRRVHINVQQCTIWSMETPFDEKFLVH